jgi:hypothetical protein
LKSEGGRRRMGDEGGEGRERERREE